MAMPKPIPGVKECSGNEESAPYAFLRLFRHFRAMRLTVEGKQTNDCDASGQRQGC